MANVILRVKREDGSWAEIPALVGPEGPQGVSIDDIVLKSQEGDVSTYSILLSDGSEKTFQVTDGAIITDVSLISTDVLIDTYKISISDGSFFNFKVTNGRGIKSIAKTSTDVLSDTYTISYNDNTSSTFKVTNGRSITKIVKSKTDVLTDTYTISYNDNTTSTYTITNGRGIDYIEKDETIGLRDRYTIHYTDGSTSYYYVTNGEAGPAGSIGNRIYLSGLVDKADDEEGYGRVKELKESDFDLSKFTVVGSPTITDDGIASGFNSGNYLKSNTISITNANWEVTIPLDTTNLENGNVGVFSIPSIGFIYIDVNKSNQTSSMFIVQDWTESGTANQNIVIGKKYIIKWGMNNGKHYSKIKADDSQVWSVVEKDCNVVRTTNSQFNIGIDKINNLPCTNGQIDLKQFSITVDGKEVFNGNKTGLDVINDIEIPYTLSKTGSKIVDVAYRDRVEDCYNQYGAGNYYLFSSAKEQFALPMPDIYGLIENLKLDITPIEGADW